MTYQYQGDNLGTNDSINLPIYFQPPNIKLIMLNSDASGRTCNLYIKYHEDVNTFSPQTNHRTFHDISHNLSKTIFLEDSLFF